MLFPRLGPNFCKLCLTEELFTNLLLGGRAGDLHSREEEEESHFLVLLAISVAAATASTVLKLSIKKKMRGGNMSGDGLCVCLFSRGQALSGQALTVWLWAVFPLCPAISTLAKSINRFEATGSP